MKNKVTDATYEFYCQQVRYWLKEFGVMSYTVFFDRTTEKVAAMVRINNEGRSLTFVLPRHLEDSSREAVGHSALHEVVHGVVAKLSAVGYNRHSTEAELEDAEEAVVCRVTQVVWNLSKRQSPRG